MAFTNLSKLQNISPINLSFDNLTDPVTAVNHVKEVAQNEVGNLWFITGIIVLFFMFIWWFYREDRGFAFDITRSIMISSSWCFFISVGFILSGWVNSVLPIIWFLTIFTVSIVAIMKLKEKNL